MGNTAVPVGCKLPAAACKQDGAICLPAEGDEELFEACSVFRDEVTPGRTQVYLNVYHLSDGWSKTNCISKQFLGIGGAFHVGVEIYGTEYYFGGDGVCATEPRISEKHVYHQSIPMGLVALSPSEVELTIDVLSYVWNGDDYDMLDKNCCSFAEALCLELVGVSIPAWVSRFPQLASAAAATLEDTIDVKRLAVDLCAQVILDDSTDEKPRALFKV
mmetsp:Transcript_82236/g.142907  ORF Transcript_82236/g.142907 Transcript_82236/m.142907 type:complete len:217 (+) Transcript_82236:78-728(+)